MKNYYKEIAGAALKGAVIGGAAAGASLFLLAPGTSSRRQREPFMGTNVAHRGLHSRDKSVPENSLEAFRLAAEAGYGIELDVQFSKDKQVVVFHDDTLDRVCGVHARVDELTYDELKELRLCGSDQIIPLFTEVLGVIRGRSPIICELKNGRNNRELCEKTYEIISGYRGDICVESFNPMIVAWFRFHAPDLLRGQLSAQCDNLGGILGAWLSSRMLIGCIGRPQFIAHRTGKKSLGVKLAELLGAMRVTWTAHDRSEEAKCDTVIFEAYRPPVQYK